ncbi:hypothetical protein F4561_005151 [Lipingzhangella halophila]|uniref:Uncharacterized protein n=1 Tax=Lipingzhangella halophila TaxID=1783352 RepID=A0A7W7RMT1_9ACTN|nr:hypothetical protein [Lipingzhangella halophila]
MPSMHDPLLMLNLALEGFRTAKHRYEGSDSSKYAYEVFVPLAEALWWARSVDEGFENLDGDPYKAERDAHASGRVLPGLRFARNRTNHQQALMVTKRNGVTWPVTWPIRWVSIDWRPLAELPPGRPDTNGERHYSLYLEGGSARDTLDSAAEWFGVAMRRQGTKFASDHRGSTTP